MIFFNGCSECKRRALGVLTIAYSNLRNTSVYLPALDFILKMATAGSKKRREEPPKMDPKDKPGQIYAECPVCGELKTLNKMPCHQYCCKGCLDNCLEQHWRVRARCPLCRHPYTIIMGRIYDAKSNLQ